jgi:hypothetical protein
MRYLQRQEAQCNDFVSVSAHSLLGAEIPGQTVRHRTHDHAVGMGQQIRAVLGVPVPDITTGARQGGPGCRKVTWNLTRTRPPSAAALYTSSMAGRPSATRCYVYEWHFSAPRPAAALNRSSPSMKARRVLSWSPAQQQPGAIQTRTRVRKHFAITRRAGRLLPQLARLSRLSSLADLPSNDSQQRERGDRGHQGGRQRRSSLESGGRDGGGDAGGGDARGGGASHGDAADAL